MLEVLIHHCVCPRPHSGADPESEKGNGCVYEAQEFLFGHGLLRADQHPMDGKCLATPKGHAHLSQILSLPPPVARWIGHDGKAIPTPDTPTQEGGQ